MTRKMLPALLAAGLLGAFHTASAEDVVVVAAEKYAFVPAEITIRPGTRVRWENRDRRQYHSVYFKDLGDQPGDYFFPGESRERVFDTPGSFSYICEPHWKTHGMTGVVHVIDH
jgi:plastocyanin